MITKNLIDEAVKGNNLEQLMNNALYFLVATLLFILFLSLKYYFQNFIEINVINSLKQDMIKKINNIEYGELLKKDLGYFTQRINKDIDKIKNLIISDYSTFIINLFYVSTVILIMIKLNIFLTLVLLLLIPIFILFTKIFIPKLNELNSEIMKKNEEIDSIVEEAYNGILTLRAHNSIFYIEKKIKKVIENIFGLYNKEIKLNIIYEFVIVTGTMNLASLLIYCIGGYLVYRRVITAGTLVAFSLYFSRLWDLIEFFMEFPKKLRLSLLSLERIKSLFDIDEENKGSIFKLDDFKSLKLKDVDFYYDDKQIIKGLNFIINKGDKIGIKGRNGIGKSTLSYLIIKLINPISGTIYYNDINYQLIDPSGLREKIILIPSEAYIFNTTIIENINLNSESDIKKEIKEDLLALINNNNVILEEGVSNKGQSLSGGEKKIVQLARGLSKNADIYILDEPLNFIDIKYKKKVINFLDSYLKDKTFIIISHDEDIFEICDKVYRLEDGVLLLENM